MNQKHMASISFRMHTWNVFNVFRKMDFPECHLHMLLPFHPPVHYIQQDWKIF